MRIGTIAQHANVGPTGFRSIVDELPGRLNDYDLTLWFDFTDNSTISVSGTPTPVEVDASSFSITDKGPNAVSANAQTFGPDTKGPVYRYNNDLDNSSDSQNFHNYGQGGVDAKDVLGFSNPTSLSTRAFTWVIIFDPTPPGDESDIGTVDQTLIHFVGSSTAPNVRNVRFDTVHNSDGDRFEFYIQKNDGSEFTLSNSKMKLSATLAGTVNSDFNYAVITGDSDANINFYLKGQLVNSDSLGVSQTIPSGGACKLFSRNDGLSNLTNQVQSKMYEFMVFNTADPSLLNAIDLYVKNKYDFKFGRINGF
tara:strand:- start:341 stop:1267 length:927 start_codon:yes stop_codon:yes gene_type:complete